jgi:hypothetical protein
MGLLTELADAFEPPNIDMPDPTPIDAESQSQSQRAQSPKAQTGRDFDSLNLEASRQGRDRWNREDGRPFVLTRPDAGRLDIPPGNRVAPGRKALEDQIRLTRFNASSRGVLFQLQQGTLQAQNARRLTRIYDPSAGQQSAVSLLVSKKRHAEADDRIISSIAGQAGRVFGLDVSTPRSADREEEIRAVTGGEGYLINQGPEVDTSVVGAQFQQFARRSVAQRLPDLAPDRFSRIPDGPRQLQLELERVQGGEYDQAPGTAGWRDAEGRLRFNRYNPTFPRTSRDGTFRTPDGVPNINKPSRVQGSFPDGLYDTVTDRAERDRGDAEDRRVEFRLGGETPYATDVPPADSDVYSAEGDTADLYRENRVDTGPDAEGGEQYILHRRPARFEQITYGLPNYSLGDLTEDQINALPVEEYDPSQPEEVVFQADGGEEFRQLLDFRIYDIVNRRRLVFRAYLEGISISNSIEYSSEQYIGRPESYHIYGGNSRSVSFSFKAFAESEATFEEMWRKVNYLEGLAYPSGYARLEGGGAYMIAPFTQLTLGNVFRQQPGFIESLDIEVSDDYPWELATGRQLTRGVDVSMTYSVIENRLPRTGQKFFEAEFIDGS